MFGHNTQQSMIIIDACTFPTKCIELYLNEDQIRV